MMRQLANLLKAARRRTKGFGDRHGRWVEIVGGDRHTLGDEVLDQPAPHPAKADKADAFECRHLIRSLLPDDLPHLASATMAAGCLTTSPIRLRHPSDFDMAVLLCELSGPGPPGGIAIRDRTHQ